MVHLAGASKNIPPHPAYQSLCQGWAEGPSLEAPFAPQWLCNVWFTTFFFRAHILNHSPQTHIKYVLQIRYSQTWYDLKIHLGPTGISRPLLNIIHPGLLFPLAPAGWGHPSRSPALHNPSCLAGFSLPAWLTQASDLQLLHLIRVLWVQRP